MDELFNLSENDIFVGSTSKLAEWSNDGQDQKKAAE